MEYIFSWINELTSFQQSFLGSAAFAVSSWIIHRLFKKAKSSGAAFLEAYSILDVYKHTLHKEYVRSQNIQLASFGASIALLQASRWVVRGVLTLVFFFGVHSIVARDWIYVAAAWFTFNCMLEAWGWLKDSSDTKHISHVPNEKAQEIYNALKPLNTKAAVEADDS
jgi:hypothetical protein